MALKDLDTEDLIRQTALRMFFAEGNFNATMQDIAHASGISRTLVNYYFRTKDALIQEIYREGHVEIRRTLDEVIQSSQSFEEKVESIIEFLTEEVSKYPYRELYLIEKVKEVDFYALPQGPSPVLQSFLKEIGAEIEKGTVRKMEPENFLINIFSLLIYPIITESLYTRLLNLDKHYYHQLLRERKQIIKQLLFN